MKPTFSELQKGLEFMRSYSTPDTDCVLRITTKQMRSMINEHNTNKRTEETQNNIKRRYKITDNI